MQPLEGPERSSGITGLLSEGDRTAGSPMGAGARRRQSNNPNEDDGDVGQEHSRERGRGVGFSCVVKRSQRDLRMDSMLDFRERKENGTPQN